MLDKRTQCGRLYKGEIKYIDRPEKELQDFCNAHAKASSVRSFRVPDNSRIKALAGFPDNLLIERITGNICIAMCLEHKTKTNKRGKQIPLSNELGYVICQTEEDIEAAIWNFRKAAQKLKGILREMEQ